MSIEYDILMVGCGLAAATYCAILKQSHKILVMDIRSHVGGNCYDYPDNGSFIHKYGPHIFHSPSPMIVDFLSKYTEWTPTNFQFEAEIDYNGLRITPFPYTKNNAQIIGKELTPEEIISLYFEGYSQKMWGHPWAELPHTITGRVPKILDKPEYFPGQFVGFPKNGYTRMIENMLDGVEVRLNVGPYDWKQIRAKKVIYMGRPDRLHSKLQLDFRSLDMQFIRDTSKSEAIRNFCHLKVPHTRKIWHGKLTGGNSDICSIETPKQASFDDLTPFYPMQFAGNPERFNCIQEEIKSTFPNLLLAGRLGTYKYLDMYQVVGQSLSFAKTHFGTNHLSV